MTNAMKAKHTMLCENSLGGCEFVWKVKEFFPKEMVLVLRREGHVGNTWGQEESESIPGRWYSSFETSSGGDNIIQEGLKKWQLQQGWEAGLRSS